MLEAEREGIAASPGVEVRTEQGRLHLYGQNYSLKYHHQYPYATLHDAEGRPWASFFLAGCIDTVEKPDETVEFFEPETLQDETGVTVRQRIASTAWDKKELVWVCRPDSVEQYYKLEGHGTLADVSYFRGNYADAVVGTGHFPSAQNFHYVFNPEPTSAEQQVHPACQTSEINVTGFALPGRADWFMTPPPYCFGMSLDGQHYGGSAIEDQWLMMGIAAPIETQNFTAYRYEALNRAFSLKLTYEGMTRVEGTFKTPSVLLHYADDPYNGIAEYAQLARGAGLLPAVKPPSERPAWWTGPIFCGWGVQVEMAADQPEKKVQDFARQETYDEALEHLAQLGIHPRVVVIDDKWQEAWGLNNVDTDKWPDLPGWIERRHRFGQKVLLWLKPWEIEGLPEDMCVRRADGKPLTADPSHPDYEATLRWQVRRMLSPEGYGADGFKLDFTARTPSGNTLQHYGPEWGTALLHRYLQTIYSEAKAVKPEALIITHSPNAWFADVSDMIRLNDINPGRPLEQMIDMTKLEDVPPARTVVEQLRHRARVALAACPELLIDTDNWEMPSLEVWREYLPIQPTLGVVSLHYSDRVKGRRLEAQDYDSIRAIMPKMPSVGD